MGKASRTGIVFLCVLRGETGPATAERAERAERETVAPTAEILGETCGVK